MFQQSSHQPILEGSSSPRKGDSKDLDISNVTIKLGVDNGGGGAGKKSFVIEDSNEAAAAVMSDDYYEKCSGSSSGSSSEGEDDGLGLMHQ